MDSADAGPSLVLLFIFAPMLALAPGLALRRFLIGALATSRFLVLIFVLMLVFVLLRPDDDPFLVLVLIFVFFVTMVSSLVLLLILRPNADHC